jgi:hypothetical protein
MEGSLVAYKVFTNGSVLQASEVNENLMQQAVATFSNSAARTAAITSPVEGQLTYLLDVDRYEHWNGSEWISPFGLTLLSSAVLSASSGVSFNNVFSSAYQNYQIYWNGTASTSVGVYLRIRVGGVDATSGYTTQFLEASATAISGFRDLTAAMQIAVARSTGRSIAAVQLSNPFATTETSFTSSVQDSASGALISLRSGSNSNATSYDGCTIYPSAGTLTGNLRIYGLRN